MWTLFEEISDPLVLWTAAHKKKICVERGNYHRFFNSVIFMAHYELLGVLLRISKIKVLPNYNKKIT